MSVDWNQIYRTVYPDLVRFLYRKVWDPERAAELAQECFVRALQFRPDQPRAWLFTVAANLARDEARTVVRRKHHLTLLAVDARGRSSAPDPDAELTERETWERVRAALDSLGEGDREVLLLWDAGMSYQEIAAETGRALGAIGTTLARARKRLVAAYESREKENVARL